MVEKILPAITGLIGAVLGVTAFLLVGWTEGQKQYQIKKVEAYISFAENSWGGSGQEDQMAFLRAVSGLTVFADEPVLASLGAYNEANCSAQSDTADCKSLWADVVNAMRRSINQPPASVTTIVRSLWG
jgi:hypothetical protein